MTQIKKKKKIKKKAIESEETRDIITRMIKLG